MCTGPMKTKWAPEVDKDDFPVAEAYLSLIFNKVDALKLVCKLKKAPLEEFAPKDIIRASRLPLDTSSDSLTAEK